MSRNLSILVLAIAASVASAGHLGDAEAGTFRTRAQQKQKQASTARARASRGFRVAGQPTDPFYARKAAEHLARARSPRTSGGGDAAAKRFFDSNQRSNLGADWSPVSAPPPVISVDLGTPPQTMRY